MYFLCSTDIITGGHQPPGATHLFHSDPIPRTGSCYCLFVLDFDPCYTLKKFLFIAADWKCVRFSAICSSPDFAYALKQSVHFLFEWVLSSFPFSRTSDLWVIYTGVVWELIRAAPAVKIRSSTAASTFIFTWQCVNPAYGVATIGTWQFGIVGIQPWREYGVVTAFPPAPPVPSHTDCRVTAEAAPPSICPHFGGWGVVLAFPFLPPTLFQVVKPFHCSSTQKHTYFKHEKGGIKGPFALGMSDPLMDQLNGRPID